LTRGEFTAVTETYHNEKAFDDRMHMTQENPANNLCRPDQFCENSNKKAHAASDHDHR